MKNRKLTLLALTALLAMALFATGCSDDDDDNGMMTGPSIGDGALLRVVHASPDAGSVDVYAEGISTPLLSNVPYTATGPYLELDPGTYNRACPKKCNFRRVGRRAEAPAPSRTAPIPRRPRKPAAIAQ